MHRVASRILLVIALVASVPSLARASMRGAPGAQEVRIWEQTGGITQLAYLVNDPLLLARRVGVLTPANADYVSGAAEYYDFFYSNADGSANTNGDFLTIECAYVGCCGPGLNINEVALVYAGGQQVFGCGIASADYGADGVAGSAQLAADSNVGTTSRMGGNTVGNDRLRITVDMRCAPTPAKTSTWGRVKAIWK